MVTAKTQYSLANAKNYFSEHLKVGDYYRQGQRMEGQWFGLGAGRLNLAGAVGESQFVALCDNRHPTENRELTQRTNLLRRDPDGSAENRRIFYDFTFSPPKSVSVVGLVGEDSGVLAAHERAVRVALGEFEAYAATRVRKGGENGVRRTGNVVAALFTHETSRALDPHLHTHCVVLNATFDSVERQWKAIQNQDMLWARKFAEGVYYHELARDLREAGYQIRSGEKGGFEIVGVRKEVCEKFSKRHQQIDRAQDELLRRRPDLLEGNQKDLRERLATAERSRKIKDQDNRTLVRGWKAEISPEDLRAIRGARHQSTQGKSGGDSVQIAREAVAWAEEHLFERRSVVSEHEIWQMALEHARGERVSVADLRRITQSRGYVRKASEPQLVTLPAVLARERKIIQAARDGISSFGPILPAVPKLPAALSAEQRTALVRLLTTRDFITLFRGGAGTGKSFVLRQLEDGLRAGGREVVMLAPQRQQVADMAKAGFQSPTTVSEFLARGSVPRQAVIVVDEAGQLGGKQMQALVRLAKEASGRLILSGDTRQHGPVEASDALLALERFGELRPAQLETIRRQDSHLGRRAEDRWRIRQYRAAVKAAAEGRMGESFKRLDRLGAIVGCRLGEQQERLAAEYVRLSEQGKTSVVVAQTWSEVAKVNEQVREALKVRGLIGTKETTVSALERLDLTNAQKADRNYHRADQVVVLNRPLAGHKPGSTGRVVGALKRGVAVEIGGRVVVVPRSKLDRLTFNRQIPVKVAQGDRLQIRANRRMENGDVLTNGEIATVQEVVPDGTIVLADGRKIETGFREFLPGYAVTSYGSQGKTVDFVLFSDSAVRAATDRRQWYVTISRGRQGIRIFTPDKGQLRENVGRCGDHALAMDLLRNQADKTVDEFLVRTGWSRWLKNWGKRARIHLGRILQQNRNRGSAHQSHEHNVA